MRKKQIPLKNGCFRTEVFISPKNYKSLKAKSEIPKVWFVECRFYDPLNREKYLTGFQYRKKFSGETLQELKFTAEIYKGEMENNLDILNYNPITKVHMADRSGLLHPNLLFHDALQKTFDKLKSDYSKAHAGDVKIMLKRIEKNLYLARVDFLLISHIKTWHIKHLLDIMDLKASVYNKFRSYLMGLFKELVQYGCVDNNMIRDISKKQIVKNIREVMSPEKMRIVYSYLQKKNYPFFRYAKIFFYSGARSSELLRVQKKHVNLQNQEYKVLIKKGRSYEWVTKIIIPAAVPFWEEIILLCENDEDFIFTKRQLPSKIPINPRQISRQWTKLVKEANDIVDDSGNKIAVTENFYSFKHLFLDLMDELSYQAPIIPLESIAQRMASHKKLSTTEIYTTGKINRKNNDLKNLRFK